MGRSKHQARRNVARGRWLGGLLATAFLLGLTERTRLASSVVLAVVSSLRNRALPAKHVVFGEVGLAGEVRPVQRGQERLREAAKLGFTHAIVPAANRPKQPIPGLEVIGVERLADAVDRLRG